MRRFDKVHIEIGNVCNLQCSFCPPVERAKHLMDPELFKKILREVAPLTDLVCLHLMGDPLVHPKLDEFIRISEEHSVRLFFVTNGLLLKPEKIPLLLKPCLYQVNFSLHSFPDNFPDKDPSQYLARIFEFTDKALIERPDLYINFRLWDVTAKDRANDSGLLQKVCDHYNYEVPNTIDVRRKKSFKVKNRLYFHFDSRFIWPSLDLPVLGMKGRCHGLSSHFGIHADGTVVPCCLDKEANITLGNINEKTLLEILDSNRANEMLKGFKSGNLIEDLCRRCQFITRFQPTTSSLQN